MGSTAKMYVITNPTPPHNNSPLVSLGKFIQVILAAGYSPEVTGARIPADGIPGIPDDVPVKSYRYGGKGIMKMMSYAFLQMRMFFAFLFKFKKGDAVYFWIADKMIGAYLAAKLRGAEINFFLYGRLPDQRGGFCEKLVYYMADRASYVCAEAPSVFEQWNLKEGLRKDVINLFVPDSKITPVPFDNRSKTVAMFCRLCYGKHVDDAIKSFCKVHEVFPEYDLKIIGGGILEEEFRGLIHDLDADDYIRITGWLDLEKAKKELSMCRILLFPTDAEGVPGGILEAMSFGVPALASPVGGIPDLISDGVDGAFLSGTDADTIEAELTELLLSDKLPAMSEAAMKTIKERFSLAAAAVNFRAVKEGHKN